MSAALLLPRLLDRVSDRPVMLAGSALMVVSLLGLALEGAMFGLIWPVLLASWLLVGLGYAAVLTPSGRLLRRSSQPEDRAALFAAQFALSHTCWLVTYPLAGWLMTRFGMIVALVVLSVIAVGAVLAALRLWPADDAAVLPHDHPDLPPDHPHLAAHGPRHAHAHAVVIDDLHRRWPGMA
jgi:MFS family permease